MKVQEKRGILAVLTPGETFRINSRLYIVTSMEEANIMYAVDLKSGQLRAFTNYATVQYVNGVFKEE